MPFDSNHYDADYTLIRLGTPEIEQPRVIYDDDISLLYINVPNIELDYQWGAFMQGHPLYKFVQLNPEISADICRYHRAYSLPTVIMFHKAIEIGRVDIMPEPHILSNLVTGAVDKYRQTY